MRTPAQIAGHPIHPMLVTLPIGLWLFSLACDLIARASDAPASWATASFYAMVGGILGALVAALPGLLDLRSLQRLPIHATAMKHMALNLTVVVLYLINAALRWGDTEAAAAGLPLTLSILAVGLLAVSGWLGGKMVYEAGVGVHTQEIGEGATHEGWSRERPDAMRRPQAAPGMRGDHAFAGDAERTREPRIGERPAAGRSRDNPRE